MAVLKLWLDTRNKQAQKFPLVIEVSHRKKRKYIPSGYKLSTEEWDGQKITKPFQNSVRANALVQAKFSIANEVLANEQNNLKKLDVFELTTIIENAINEKFSERKDEEEINQNNSQDEVIETKTSFFEYTQRQVEILKKAKQHKYAINFEDAISSLKTFVNDKELLITEINETFIRAYEADCKSRDMKINAYGAYLRAVRRIINLAIKDQSTEVTLVTYPFGRSGYSIKVEKTAKRAVKENVIDMVRGLKLEKDSSIWHHKNFFLLMFNWRGMNFIDLAFLKRNNIIEDRLIYERRKTKDKFNIKLTDEAKEILEYYIKGKKTNQLLFPIIDDIIDCGDDEYIRVTCDGRLKTHNKYLKKIAKLLGLEINLTSYVVRHSFATIALRKGVSKSMIGDMLGHENYETTETYFEGFESDAMDDAADIAFSKPKKKEENQLENEIKS